MRYILIALIFCATITRAQAAIGSGPNPQQESGAGGSVTTGSPDKGNIGLGGTVNDTSGAVLVGAKVTARNASGETRTADTDADGKFQITGLAPGKYEISVTAKGFVEFKATNVKVTADQHYIMLAIVLSPVPEAGGAPAGAAGNVVAAGTVTDIGGAPVVRATVTLRNTAGEAKTFVTDAQGNFAITGLTPDNYQFSVTAKGFAEFKMARLTVSPGEEYVPITVMLTAKPSPAIAAARPGPGTPPPAAPVVKPAPSAPPEAPAAVAVPGPSIPQGPPPAPAVVSNTPPPPGSTGVGGTVTDTSGALIPGAKVTVRNAAGQTKTVQTDAEGKFQIIGLIPDKYDISVTAQGFSESKTAGFNVISGSVGSLNVQLQLATASTQVNVQAQRLEQVETENAEISGTITRQEVVELGLNGRNFTQLIALAPGVSNQTSQDEAKVGVVGSAKYSVNGGRVEYNTFEVDGSDVLNTDIAASHGHTTLLVYPSPDAIQEMKVLTSNYGAQFGRTASGTVQVVTKSGSDKFHGDAYEFVRNNIFNARNFFDLEGVPLYRKNDFGGTIGGPLYIPHLYEAKGKTYFFISEEYRRERFPVEFNQGVPSDLERGYDASTNTYGNLANFSDVCPLFSDLGPGGTFTHTSYLDCPANGAPPPYYAFTNNTIYISPGVRAILQAGFIPRANSTTGCVSTIDSCYVGTVSPPTQWREDLVRADHNLTSSTKLSFHAVHDHWDTTTAVPQWANEVGGLEANSFPTVLNDFQGPGLSLISNMTTVISPTTVNNFSFGYTWQQITLADLAGPGVSLSPAGLDSISSPWGSLFNNNGGGKIPGLVFAGNNGEFGGYGFAVDTSYMPWSHLLQKSTLRDDLSKVLGKHTLQLGVQFVRAERNEQSAANGANTGDVQGLLTFTNVANNSTTGNAFADFLLNGDSSLGAPPSNINGDIRYYQQDNEEAGYRVSYWDVEPYVQDDWRVTHRLTVNLGLRLSLFGNWKPVNQTLYNWVAGDYNPAVWDNSQYCIYHANGYIGTSGCNGLSNSPPPTPLPLETAANLDPTLTNGLVQCGTKGVPASCQSSHIFNPAPRIGFAWDPRGDGRTSLRGGYGVFFEHGTGSEANAGSLMGNPPQVLSMTEDYPKTYPQIGQPPNTKAGTRAMYPLNMVSIPTVTRWPYVQQWSFGVQHELARDTVATITYVGDKGTRLATAMQINQLPPVSNKNNPFTPGEPIVSTECLLSGTNVNAPFSTSNSFTINGSPVTYGANPSAYVGLLAACNGNPGGAPGSLPLTYDINILRPYQGIGAITSIQNVGNSIYNSLQVTLRRHLRSLDLGLSYTYGHSIDTASDRYEATFVDSFDLRANRASSDFDERHLLNVSYIYKLPIVDWFNKFNAALGGDEGAPQGPPSIANKLFSNWVLSGITVYQSGTPFSVIDGTSSSGISELDNAGLALGLGADSYPDLAPRGSTCGTLPLASGTFGPVLANRCRFVAPRGLTQGDAGRNSMYNPSRTNFNWAFLRDFKVWKETTLQFRAEAFNIFNTTQFRIYDPVKGNTAHNTITCFGNWDSLYTVGVSFSAGAPNCTAGNGFLRPVDAHDPRTMEFALKFSF